MVELIVLCVCCLGYLVAVTLWLAYIVDSGTFPVTLVIAICTIACVVGIPMTLHFMLAVRKPPIGIAGYSRSEIDQINSQLRMAAKRASP